MPRNNINIFLHVVDDWPGHLDDSDPAANSEDSAAMASYHDLPWQFKCSMVVPYFHRNPQAHRSKIKMIELYNSSAQIISAGQNPTVRWPTPTVISTFNVFLSQHSSIFQYVWMLTSSYSKPICLVITSQLSLTFNGCVWDMTLDSSRLLFSPIPGRAAPKSSATSRRPANSPPPTPGG